MQPSNFVYTGFDAGSDKSNGLVSLNVHHGAHSARPGTRESPDSGTACGIPWTVAADDVAGDGGGREHC